VYPAVFLIYFISVAVILLASVALIVQVSLPYNKTGRTSVLYNFILLFFRGFCGLNTLGHKAKSNTDKVVTYLTDVAHKAVQKS